MHKWQAGSDICLLIAVGGVLAPRSKDTFALVSMSLAACDKTKKVKSQLHCGYISDVVGYWIGDADWLKSFCAAGLKTYASQPFCSIDGSHDYNLVVQK